MDDDHERRIGELEDELNRRETSTLDVNALLTNMLDALVDAVTKTIAKPGEDWKVRANIYRGIVETCESKAEIADYSDAMAESMPASTEVGGGTDAI